MNRMNASDVIKAKQNRILYNSYYKPTVLESSVTSTIHPVSSIILYTQAVNGIMTNVMNTSYTSCITTCNTYVAKPTFQSYEMIHAMRNGVMSECDGVPRHVAETRWINTSTVTKVIQSTLFSTFANSGPLLPSSFRFSSSIMSSGQGPVICPLIDYHQGTSFSAATSCVNDVNQSGSCCP